MPDETPTDRTEVQVGAPTVSAATAHGFPTIPGYEIVREIGRGGMGVVYEAKQTKLDRTVALKLMKDDDPLNKARFLAEGQVIAAVKHPHVVEVYDFGETAAGPYIAMEYLTGGSLSDGLRDASPRTVAELLAKVAAGVGAAHEQGIVHRDLKPGNVLLAAGGSPKVTDFGLAKRSASELTQTQDAAGTPAYMAPEQARAMKFVGPPADVWSLGVMLYEALSGKRPFVADTDMELLIRIQNETPTTLRALTKGIPADLETVCLKCLEKEPERRYANATELAADLTAWIEGKPITARRATTMERVVLWVRRKPTVAAAWALGLLVVLLTAFAATATSLWQRAEAQKDTAEFQRGQAVMAEKAATTSKAEIEATNLLLVEARKTADAARRDAETARDAEKAAKKLVEESREALARVEYARTVHSAHLDYQRGDLTRARLLLKACRTDLRGWEWHYVHRLCHADLLTIPLSESRPTERREGIPLPVKSGGGAAASSSSDGTRVAAVCFDNTAKVFDAKTGETVLTLKGHEEAVRSVVFHPDGSQLVTASFDRTAKLWDAKSGQVLHTLTGHPGMLMAAAFSADGSRIITASRDNTAKIWNAKTGKEERTLTGHSKTVYSAEFNLDGSRIVTASEDKSALVWNAKTGEKLFALEGHSDEITWASFTTDGSRIVTASNDGMAAVWDAKSGKPIAVLKGHTAGLRSAAFSPDGLRIVTASSDNTVKLWDTKTGGELLTLKGHTDTVWSARFSPNGARIVTASPDRTLKVWDANVAAEFGNLAAPGGAIHLVSFDLERARFVSPSDNDTAKVWEAKTGMVVLTLNGHKGLVTSAKYRSDGQRIVTASEDKSGRIWDAKTGTTLHVLSGHTASLTAANFSTDGTRIATASRDATAKIWNADTGQEIVTLTGHTAVVDAIAFSPDGFRVATASRDATVKIWDTTTGRELLTLKGHTGSIQSVAYNPDGSRIVTCEPMQSTKLWDAKTGAEVLTISSESDWFPSGSFSPDGQRLILASKNNTARVFDATPIGQLSSPKPGEKEVR